MHHLLLCLRDPAASPATRPSAPHAWPPLPADAPDPPPFWSDLTDNWGPLSARKLRLLNRARAVAGVASLWRGHSALPVPAKLTLLPLLWRALTLVHHINSEGLGSKGGGVAVVAL
jgi:hypothetical protein